MAREEPVSITSWENNATTVSAAVQSNGMYNLACFFFSLFSSLSHPKRCNAQETKLILANSGSSRKLPRPLYHTAVQVAWTILCYDGLVPCRSRRTGVCTVLRLHY